MTKCKPNSLCPRRLNSDCNNCSPETATVPSDTVAVHSADEHKLKSCQQCDIHWQISSKLWSSAASNKLVSILRRRRGEYRALNFLASADSKAVLFLGTPGRPSPAMDCRHSPVVEVAVQMPQTAELAREVQVQRDVTAQTSAALAFACTHRTDGCPCVCEPFPYPASSPRPMGNSKRHKTN